MNKFRDWLYRVYFAPSRKAYAQARMKALVRKNDEAYQRLMNEFGHLERELHDMENDK